ncbi:hypothetical protein U8607_15350 [Methylobacterium durans]|uniref:hypothetical protein n=1 Tax=Methylobacterium durans TaxID=2202825 RepID=UPI002AFE0699|nr:hypothetical protein [Methylobacterium durans]MEA1833460.1 hypothetical protein [Methylobacterium durans]
MSLTRIAFTAALLAATGASAQTEDQPRRLDVPSGPATKQQPDLDTLKLASAHRERAQSVQERTNGLWQSWLVSICEGCGPSGRPYQDSIRNDMERNTPTFMQEAAASDRARMRASRALPAQTFNRRIYSDLSTETVAQIRRTPAR